jgi:hypothetical protein
VADKGARGQFFATREFGYDDVTGTLDRHQVLELAGHVNDSKLVGLRYLMPVEPGQELHTCGECGARFITLGARDAHGDLRHGYTCECGWTPAETVKPEHRGNSLRNHRVRCEVYKERKAVERQAHLAQIVQVPGREGS